MQVTSDEVQELFGRLLRDELSREEADRWAHARITAFDEDRLVFLPDSDQDRIWASIQYIYGIDLMVSPGEYLHSSQDIKSKLEGLGWDT